MYWHLNLLKSLTIKVNESDRPKATAFIDKLCAQLQRFILENKPDSTSIDEKHGNLLLSQTDAISLVQESDAYLVTNLNTDIEPDNNKLDDLNTKIYSINLVRQDPAAIEIMLSITQRMYHAFESKQDGTISLKEFSVRLFGCAVIFCKFYTDFYLTNNFFLHCILSNDSDNIIGSSIDLATIPASNFALPSETVLHIIEQYPELNELGNAIDAIYDYLDEIKEHKNKIRQLTKEWSKQIRREEKENSELLFQINKTMQALEMPMDNSLPEDQREEMQAFKDLCINSCKNSIISINEQHAKNIEALKNEFTANIKIYTDQVKLIQNMIIAFLSEDAPILKRIIEFVNNVQFFIDEEERKLLHEYEYELGVDYTNLIRIFSKDKTGSSSLFINDLCYIAQHTNFSSVHELLAESSENFKEFCRAIDIENRLELNRKRKTDDFSVLKQYSVLTPPPEDGVLQSEETRGNNLSQSFKRKAY